MATDIKKATQGYDPNATYDWNKNPYGFDLSLTENKNKDGKTVKEDDTVDSATTQEKFKGIGQPHVGGNNYAIKSEEDDDVSQNYDDTKSTLRTLDSTVDKDDVSPTELQDFYKALNKNPELTQEQEAKLRRREKAEKAIAAAGDLGAIIANVIGAAKGAKSMGAGNKGTTLSEKYAEKWNKWNAEYKNQLQAYANGLAKATQQDFANNINNRRAKVQEQKEERLRIAQEAKAQYDQLRMEQIKLNMELAKNKDAQNDKKVQAYVNSMNLRMEELKDRMANPQKYMASTYKRSGGSGSGSKSDTKYRWDNHTFKDAEDAYNNIPQKDKERITNSMISNSVDGKMPSHGAVARKYQQEREEANSKPAAKKNIKVKWNS